MMKMFDSTEKDAFVYDVYLNGQRQDFCKTANIKEGWVDNYIFKSLGSEKFEVVLDGGGFPKVRRVYGKVELKLNEFYFK